MGITAGQGTPVKATARTKAAADTRRKAPAIARVKYAVVINPPVITSPLTASGNTGVAFSYQITATNSPTSYNATGLPSGLSVNTTTGLISGTPTVVATTSVTISATNAGGTGSATLVLTVAALILDQFTDTNGVALTAHTIAPTNVPATAWTVAAGTCDIQGNRAQPETNSTVNVAVCDSLRSDLITISAFVNRAGATQDMGIVARYQDVNNYWLADMQNGGTVVLFEKSGGSYTSRASAAQPFNTNTDYSLAMALSGTTITVTVNGANAISFSSSDFQSSTKVGLWASLATVGGQIDNFQVTSP